MTTPGRMNTRWYQIEEEGSVKVLRFVLPDSVDAMEIDKVIESVLQTLDENPTGPWVVDLTDMHYMGSAMLGMMVNIRERVRKAGGELALAGLSGAMQRIFQMAALDRLFLIARSRTDAVARVSRW
jgi:anti-anti-sigma factor